MILHLLQVAPKIAPFSFGSEPSNFGDSASVQCLVTSGDFPIDFKWLFNSRPVSEFAGISTAKMGKRNSVMTIDSANGKHSGNYTCQASNSAMVVNFTAVLVINGIHHAFSIKSNYLWVNLFIFSLSLIDDFTELKDFL